jgi:RNA polymerase sigma-70 factor (ECF subfamily)
MIVARARVTLAQDEPQRAAPSALESALETEVVELFDEHRVAVLRYLGSFGISMQDGEEVVQEVFLALFQHLRKGKPRTNLHGWIFRVAHNLGLKRCQVIRRETLGDRADLQRIDPDPNPEEQAASGQRRTRLLAVIEALPELDRQCLYLRAEGLRYREIKDILGISLGGVALSLERSLERLGRVNAR